MADLVYRTMKTKPFPVRASSFGLETDAKLRKVINKSTLHCMFNVHPAPVKDVLNTKMKGTTKFQRELRSVQVSKVSSGGRFSSMQIKPRENEHHNITGCDRLWYSSGILLLCK